MNDKMIILNPKIKIEREEDVFIVRNIENGNLFFTNEVGAFILNNENNSVDTIKNRITTVFSNVDKKSLLSEVNEFITECINKKVISFE